AKLALPFATDDLKPKDAADLRVKVFDACVKQFSGTDARIRLAQAYLDAGEGAHLASTLKDAADMDSENLDESGLTDWNRINNVVQDAKTKHLLSAADATSLATEYSTWMNQFIAQQASQRETQKDLSQFDTKPTPPQVPAPKANATTPAKPGSPAKPKAGSEKHP
ncbi:MAG TPA: hypothetical protein VMI31_17195, partial [Fimbriimonadaceae bacterium]|nr:hypothetical protein [Fimbriimonadaceae bacterium]